jgi:hypothetical protein
MVADVRELVEQHHISYEVWPYDVVVDIHQQNAPAIYQKVQFGFDIELYGSGVDRDLTLFSGRDEFRQTLSALEAVAEAIKPQAPDGQHIEVIPFEANLCYLPSHSFRPEALLRIRITNFRGPNQPAGPLEVQTREAIEKQLQALGVKSTR